MREVEVLLIDVLWVDAVVKHGWEKVEAPLPLSVCRTVGWLSGRRRDRYEVAQSVHYDRGGEVLDVSGKIAIPRGGIVDVQILEV